MSTTIDLGAFLRTRRSRLRPQDVALPDFGGRRRVAGLRREEIAQLAGVSVDYYIRMEQGRAPNPSSAVLDALARALRLDEDETRHLHRLGQPRPATRHTPRPRPGQQQVRPMLRRLLDELRDVPAMVMGRRMDVLAWNTAASALLGDYAALEPAERNIPRITFLDPASRDLFADWSTCARENVAYLRLEAGRHPDDPELAGLIGELSVKSADFRRWWAEHPVQDKTSGTKRFHHPLVGDLTLTYDTLRAADDPDQALITYTAEPHTPSHDALRMLLTWTTPTPTTATTPPSTVGPQHSHHT
ncbi:helix-turn-helix transcriptional regulator [Streptomyces griseocarneus]|uniref:helix-turn-helix transcriptional regulator n=1 Tax=Streptomyces griseocarneus TaxID=51201 RepID=UPI001CCBF521|nr:helix-turn-helix transcriptional regulator [Streptomyces griseocarneus]MBZ6475294.1 helix-turn-helix transcriptional regulator [Streptomyces griseocarneus]